MKHPTTTPKLFSLKSVAFFMAWLMAFTALGIMWGIYFHFKAMDQRAGEEMARRVSVALKVELQRQEDIIEEYAYWDTAHEKTIATYDELWVEENMGQYLLNRYEYGFTMVIRPDRTPVFMAKPAGGTVVFKYLLEHGLETMLLKSRAMATDVPVVSGYIQLLDGIYRVSTCPFVDEITNRPRKDYAYVVFGYKMDPNHVEALAQTYELPGVHLLSKPDDDKPLHPLINAKGEAIAYLTWDTPHSLQGMLPKLFLTVVGFFLFMGSIALFILKRDHANRDQYEEQLYLQATKDGLTGANNRRHFMELARQEFAIHKRNERLLSVMMMDLDHFKAINDTHGHAMGDKALVHFSSLCRGSLREADIFGRIGGEEFAIILPDTGLPGAELVAIRMRRLLEETSRNPELGLPPMTVSIGIAPMDENELFSTMLAHADTALYKAKNTGRNKVVTHNKEDES
ncbi:diguanylate cyclase [Pseudodesulfovibrio sp. zrk46]|uniref:sensor domain-containing diguanylate cyclase n=1 Tax=Pseudodesulfovibrio sp. zrk46 TaxID=2725288 RepID=UPI001449B8AB|nr:diguanylate cyclase [Pseudodesulfovibrio sp. zrk46]QJB56049.1 diguanylate cyclase [Pseudodesulfovibrio sp. zrk46]